MAYLDTSLLVAALTREQKTSAAQRWLAAQDPENLCISDWTVTEFSAALSMKLRMRHLDQHARAGALSEFTFLCRDTFRVHALDTEHFRAAAQLADRFASGLRAGDALHLALAASLGETIISLDRTLIKAALAAGIRAESI